MPFFVIQDHPALPLVVAKLVERRPKPADKDGFRTIYCAPLSDGASEGAEHVIELLDAAMGDRTRAPGVYQSKPEPVLEAYRDIVVEHGRKVETHWAERIAAGIAGAALLAAMCFLAVPAGIFWLAVCAFKKQSGLLTMAETAVVWSIFDWTPLIKRLWRIAFDK